MWFETFDTEAARRFPEMEILREEPMARHTTFRVGGPARRMARPASAEEPSRRSGSTAVTLWAP